MVDNDCAFGAVERLPDGSAASCWRAFVLGWATTLAGYPDITRKDAGSQLFRSSQFQEAA